ncbi:MAG: WYL domain-containing protein [Bacteroidaceae bacterium]|nr:WYL domain-containing protein [Bacteroidaceae bacterium]
MEHASIYRIFRMLEMLGSNVDYTTPELTERLDVCERSTFRYIETLKLAGCTIIKKGKNIHKLVKIPSEGIKLEELVLISSEEAYLIHRMLRSIAGDCPLVHNLELKLAAIFDAISITEIVGNKTAAENIKELKKAIKNQERVILMNYESGHTMQISNREVEPYAFSTNYTDVHAYEITTGLNKTFKICRIGWVKPTSYEWEHEDEHEVITPDCFRMNGKEAIPITLKMSLMAKNLLVEEYPLSMRDISYEEGCWWLRTVVKDLGGVGRFYLGLSDQIEIHDSPKLEAYITKRVRDTLVKHI